MSGVSIDLGYQSICSINNSDWHQDDFDDEEDKELLPPSEIVIASPIINIVIDYPVTNSAEYKHENPGGFTRKLLAELIAGDYQLMYDEEEKTTVIQPGTLAPFLINRNQTDGRYGIWGHDIGDLILHTATYFPETGNVFCRCDS
jgi:hypothetical protein